MRAAPFVVLLAVQCACFTANVVDYGAKGDGATMNTAAFRAASAAIKNNGGGLLLVPTGQFIAGAFNLTSNTTLEVQGTILGAQEKSQYPIIPPLPSYGVSRDVGINRYQALIMTHEVRNVTIRGTGVIDGQGSYWWDLHKSKQLSNGRPRLVELYNTTDIELTGVTLRNSGFWTVHPVYSKNFHMHHLQITAPSDSPNTDGVDPDSSENVLIEHCDISCGDDVVAIKSGIDAYGRAVGIPARNVTVQHNIFRAGHSVAIGSEVSGGVQDILIYNNTLLGPLGVGMKIKTSEQRGGYIRNVRYTSNTFGQTSTALVLDTRYSHGPPFFPLTKITGIVYSNLSRLQGTTQAVAPGEWTCFEDSPCEGFVLTDIMLQPASRSWQCSNMKNTTVRNVMPDGLAACSNE